MREFVNTTNNTSNINMYEQIRGFKVKDNNVGGNTKDRNTKDFNTKGYTNGKHMDNKSRTQIKRIIVI
jgi:hypothetical protein